MPTIDETQPLSTPRVTGKRGESRPTNSMFSQGKRMDMSNRTPHETWFSFLERSGLPDMEEARNGLDRWFQAWPDNLKADALNKLKSRRADTSHGMMFELYLHHKLKEMGCSVEIEPTLTSKRNVEPLTPDFLVEYENVRCYVEAFLASDKWYSDAQADSLARLVKELNKHPNRDFFLSITLSHVPERTLSYKKLIRPIIEWLGDQSLNIEEINHLTQTFALLTDGNPSLVPVTPEYVRNNADATTWDIELVPVSADYRTDEYAMGRPLVAAITPMNGSRDQGYAQLKERIREKVSRYDELDAPLVVAAGTLWLPSHKELEFQFYGRPTASYSQSQNGAWVPVETSITPDGLWLRKVDGQYKQRAPQLFGVWSFGAPVPNNPNPKIRLYTNPYIENVERSLPTPFFRGPHSHFTKKSNGTLEVRYTCQCDMRG